MIKQCGVIGNPVEHSQSPRVHQQFARQLGLEIQYDKIFAEKDRFVETVNDFFAAGGLGLNITLPFKQAAFELAAIKTERATQAQSVNTLWKNQRDELVGDTTDGQGLVNALQNQGIGLDGCPIVFLGAGGAARSILPALLNEKAHLFLINRTPENAELLVEQFSMLGNIKLFSEVSAARPALIINSMPQDGEKWLQQNGLKNLNDCAVCDISYGERAEPFLNWCAKQSAAQYFDGWGMLVEQAALSFEIWHGQRPDTKPLIPSKPAK